MGEMEGRSPGENAVRHIVDSEISRKWRHSCITKLHKRSYKHNN